MPSVRVVTGVVPSCLYEGSQILRSSSTSFVHDLLLSVQSENDVLERPSNRTPNAPRKSVKSRPTASHPSSPSCAAPYPKSCDPPSSTYQKHRTQHSNHHAQKRPRADFTPQLIPSQLPSFIVQRADIRVVDGREERPGSWVGHAG